MALEFTKNGKMSLANRLAIPENGHFIKDIKKFTWLKGMLHSSLKWEITIDLIADIFNPIKDPFTNLTLHSSNDQFELFLQQNNLKFIRQDFSYIVYPEL